ncbi:MAG TPA: YkgJ family cysteine cluster protein [Thiobacillus sp.]
MTFCSDTLTETERIALQQSITNVQCAAEQSLSACRSGGALIEFVANLQNGVDRVVQTAVDRGVDIQCKAGCSDCCHAKVEATAPEVFRIANVLMSRPMEEVDMWIAHLTEHVRHSTDQTKWALRRPCPFLSQDLCVMYEVRPGACRKAHSLDVHACKAGAETIPQSLDVVLAAEALMKGTANAYQTLGYDASRHELAHAVLCVLTDAGIRARWLKGEPVLGDATHDSA